MNILCMTAEHLRTTTRTDPNEIPYYSNACVSNKYISNAAMPCINANITSMDNDTYSKCKSLNNNVIFSEIKHYYIQHRHNFIFAHINVNSIRHKFEPLKECLSHDVFDILSIQETKLDDSFPVNYFKVDKYCMYRKDCKENEGGLLLYVRNDIKQCRRSDIELFAFNNDKGRIEIIATEITIRNEKWIVLCMYKQPKVTNQTLIVTIDDIMIKLTNEYNCNILIIGDINVNVSKHTPFTACLEINGLQNIIDQPTCFKGKPSIIDLFITNKPKRFYKCICTDVGLSDFHSLVCVSSRFIVSKRKSRTILYRSFKKFNEDNYINDLMKSPYDLINMDDDIDVIYKKWYTITMNVVNNHAPMKQRTITGYKSPFMNGNLRRAINVKKMLKRKYYLKRTIGRWDKFKTQRNLVTKLRKQSKGHYLQKECSKDYTSNFWKVIKPMLSNKGGSKDDNIILLINDKVVNSQADICSLFNNYFVHVADNIGINDMLMDSDTIHSCMSSHRTHPSINLIDRLAITSEFQFVSVDEFEIYVLLRKLNVKKATGFDNLPSKLLKLSAEVLCKSISSIINCSIDTSKFPSEFKKADICPVPKHGNATDIANYRPISILPNISKIFERVYVRQLSEYFEDIFDPRLSGFRTGHSCETVLIRMNETIRIALDEGKIVCAVLMDLSKAFDCIPHKLLLAKFRSYGVSINACTLLLSYFLNRKQRVKLGLQSSDWDNIIKGSAQGSIFGPFCYNVFINDMFSVLDKDVQIYNYADDNTLLYIGYDYDQVKHYLLKNVSNLMQWLSNNCMKVNSEKFQCIVFGKHDNLGTFKIDEKVIVPTSNVKLLGMHLDSKLNYSTHVSNVCMKAGRQLQAISRLSHTLNERTKLLLYNSFMQCYFNYCNVIWHFCSNSDTFKMEKLQKRALQFILRDFHSSYNHLLLKCNKQSLYIMRIKKIVEFVYKLINDMHPSYLDDILHLSENVYDFRNILPLHVPKFNRITYGKNRLGYMSTIVWNSLDNKFKHGNNLNQLKIILREWKGPKCNCGFCIQCKIQNL